MVRVVIKSRRGLFIQVVYLQMSLTDFNFANLVRYHKLALLLIDAKLRPAAHGSTSVEGIRPFHIKTSINDLLIIYDTVDTKAINLNRK